MRRIFFIYTAAVFLAALSLGNAKLVMSPYLQGVSDSSIYILAESSTKDFVYADYWEEGKPAKQDKSAFYRTTDKSGKDTYVHRIWLRGLKPATKYFYRVHQDGDTSTSAFFYTAPLLGESFRFAIFGDCRSNPKIHAKLIPNLMKKNPRFSIYVGDLCHNSDYDSWKEEFFIKEQLQFSSQVPFFNAIGNHEDWEDNTMAFQQGFQEKTRTEAYYSFDYGDAHYLIISTEHDTEEGSKQWKFVEEDLKKSTKQWKFVAFHVHAYCGGGHGENDDMIEMSRKLFVPNNVTAVFNGHTHFYQHNRVDGLDHIIFGGGGAPLYSPKKKPYTVKSAKKHNYGICDVTKDKIIITAYDLKDNIIEVIEIKK